MKKSQALPLVFISLFALNSQLIAQLEPQWKYHLAFEDNAGARDTVWFVHDEDATFFGNDTELGEVPVTLNLDTFNVFMYNVSQSYPDLDTFKLIAHPWYEVFEHEVYALNFELPIKISWDTLILHSPVIPPEPVGWMNYARLYNDYFFFYGNLPVAHEFDMTISDSVVAPDPFNTDPWVWIQGVHFPMSVFLSQNPTLSILEDAAKDHHENLVVAYPNPTHDIIYFDSSYDMCCCFIIDPKGRYEDSYTFNSSGINQVNLSNYDRGYYLVKIQFNSGETVVKKVLKN